MNTSFKDCINNLEVQEKRRRVDGAGITNPSQAHTVDISVLMFALLEANLSAAIAHSGAMQ